jgi:hypothetical protein
MVDVVAEEVVVLDDAAAEALADAEFDSGFTDAPTEVTPPVVKEEAAEAVVVEPAVVVPEVKFRQITEAEYTALMAASTQIEQIRADQARIRDTAAGKIGGLERTLATLQAATPAGTTVEITDDMFADLKKEYPELGDLVLKGMRNVAGKLKGTAPAVAPDPTQIDTTLTNRLVALQIEGLDDERPNWREVTGPVNSNTPYRQWLAKQPAEYQAKLGSTNSAAIISRSITKFETDAAAEKTAADAVTAAAEKAAAAKLVKKPTRQQVLEAAATPRGAGGHTPAVAAEDDFAAGFKNG